MMTARIFSVLLVGFLGIGTAVGQEGTIPFFEIESSEMELTRSAQVTSAFDKSGHRFGLFGTEDGTVEAWAYPLKLFREFRLSFFEGSSTRPILSRDVASSIRYLPEAAVIRYVHQAFTADAVFIVPPDEPGAIILLHIQSDEPISVVGSFLPVMQPMWPAGLGGQYARWDDSQKAYLISESSRKNAAWIGSPAASGMSYTPAHMLGDSPNEFRIDISNPEFVKTRYIPIAITGGTGSREEMGVTYQRLLKNPESIYRDTKEYYETLLSRSFRIETPDKDLDTALRWAVVSYDNLVIDHPAMGRGLVAGLGASGSGGRPGFGWFFGGDTYVNSFSMLGLGAFDEVRDAIRFQQQFQREDGKMPHEVTQATDFVDWFGDYPYAYIHADTTPYYIVALHDYVRRSGDRSFLLESWPSLVRAFNWCLTTDADNDGLMDNSLAGLGALEFGDMTGIETDIYLGSVWVKATMAMTELAGWLNKTDMEQQAGAVARLAQRAFEDRFWDESRGQYAYGFDSDGGHVDELTPWPAVGLIWNLGRLDRSLKSLRKMSTSGLSTDWGVRMLSVSSPRFEPLNYNYGAVWPFLTSWVTTAQYTYGRPVTAYPLLRATASHTFERALGHVTEVFSGIRHTWPQESVAHQGFCTAGTVLPLINGLFGLNGDAVKKTITVAPQLPRHWEKGAFEGFRVGDSRFSMSWIQSTGVLELRFVSPAADKFDATISPVLGLGSRINRVLLDDQPIEFTTENLDQGVRVSIDQVLQGSNRLRIEYSAGPELASFFTRSRIGDENKTLKIIDLREQDGLWYLDVDGRIGNEYNVQVFNPAAITNLAGASITGHTMVIRIDSDAPVPGYHVEPGFSTKRITWMDTRR